MIVACFGEKSCTPEHYLAFKKSWSRHFRFSVIKPTVFHPPNQHQLQGSCIFVEKKSGLCDLVELTAAAATHPCRLRPMAQNRRFAWGQVHHKTSGSVGVPNIITVHPGQWRNIFFFRVEKVVRVSPARSLSSWSWLVKKVPQVFRSSQVMKWGLIFLLKCFMMLMHYCCQTLHTAVQSCW